MKKFILTIDYELHLGNITGSVRECMIEPTHKLMDVLDCNHSKMTVFWDILHYYKLLELRDTHPLLKEDCLLIEMQVREMFERGHDIQLHIHPHWLDATYSDERWVFDYSRFSLKCLNLEKNRNDIDTIYGCIYQSRILLETYMRNFSPTYRATTFRAGGYLIEPFSLIKGALEDNNITIDSSVCPDMKMDIMPFNFNFSRFPTERYSFDDDLKRDNSLGQFIEYPIATVFIPFIYKFYFRLLFHLKYFRLPLELKGTGSCNAVVSKKKSKISRLTEMLTNKEVCQLTIDSSFKEKFKYLVSKSSDGAVMILHPKFLNNHTIQALHDMLSRNDIFCNSILNNESALRQLSSK